jgi:small subunit ribosomal protein S17e
MIFVTIYPVHRTLEGINGLPSKTSTRDARIRPSLQTISLSLRIPFKELNSEELSMGIKPSYIKNLGTELLVKQREYFSGSFDENKQQLSASAVIGSKRVRNRVAGYITRKMNSKKRS